MRFFEEGKGYLFFHVKFLFSPNCPPLMCFSPAGEKILYGYLFLVYESHRRIREEKLPKEIAQGLSYLTCTLLLLLFT